MSEKQFESLVRIERAELSRTSATFVDGLTTQQWSHIGHGLGSVNACCLWWIGDWMQYGIERYGDLSRLAVQHADSFHLSEETLRKAAMVSQRIPVGSRLPTLTWSHHLEVAMSSPQQADKWLTKAEAEGWTVAELRAALRQATAQHAQPDQAVTEMAWLKAADDLWRLLKREVAATPLAQWPASRKAAVKAELEPIGAFYEAL